MTGQRVVVVGAGQAGSDAAAALRERGFTGEVTLVGEEGAVPYQRPPLSKAYLAGRMDAAGLDLRPEEFYSAHGIERVRQDRVTRIDRDAGAVVLASGRTLPYDRLVLATGARPRSLPVPGAGLTGVRVLRSLADADALRRALAGARHLAVIGGGFIGLELAATASGLGVRTAVVEAGTRVMGRTVGPEVSARLAAEHEAHGVELFLGREVTALAGDRDGHVRVVELNDGRRIPADVVVVGIGVLPEVELAADAGLEVGGGIVVDARLRTSDRAVYAIGDCARFPSPHAAGRLRLESVQNASDQARHVAAELCGASAPYTAVPWFWTDQYDLRVQIAGVVRAHDHRVTVGDPAGRFSVLCFRDGLLVGTESVNRPADHMITRRLLASDGPRPTPDEAARPGFDLKTWRAPSPVTA
ncbi:NAD(P)/FAD-dependent oxidoreductase [Streptomyces ficellus]|uniref:Pyridine nucleotide-disulfide oxidoreductase n=1 Tax=Streptomyces ficellus TaxID=1977088 RepID=A0A6I6FMI3_9ACTN|nr:FAD-dependent oxidoreductase [Streptomyces ficellus]QGV77506.1 pyridine nucleotide-disulfide oxidoreductase [Streptomyces ficellus]